MDPLTAVVAVPAPRPVLDIQMLIHHTRSLLAARVPLTLLIDLAEDSGPRSALRYEDEGGDADWLPRARY